MEDRVAVVKPKDVCRKQRSLIIPRRPQTIQQVIIGLCFSHSKSIADEKVEVGIINIPYCKIERDAES
jgi:hypothetical protein